MDNTNLVSNRWATPVVNLTNIAVALPKILSHIVVGGLLYASLVEESFSSKGDNLLNLKCAANVAWVGVELNRKWLDKNLRKLPLGRKNIEGTLQPSIDMLKRLPLSSKA